MADNRGLYYKKDKKAQIYRKVENEVENGYMPGSNGYTFYPIAAAPVWCYTAQLSQTDTFYAKTYGNSETRLFVFNYYKYIQVYDYIIYKDEWYQITRIDHTDDYNGETFVYVTNGTGQEFRENRDTMGEYTAGIFETTKALQS